MVAPKWTQYVAEAGEFEVAIGDNMTYTIRGHMKGGSIQDGGSIMENEAGVAFAFTGRLLISDYSEDYEDPDDPDTPDDPAPEVPEVTMSTGSLYRYNDNIYYLQLKDANPADLYETTFYLKLPASDSPLLASGDYMAATTGEEMTIDASKSFWNFTDKDNHNDKIKNRLKEGTKIHIVSNGDHNYTITGTLEGTSDKTGKNTALKINFSGTLPFEDYADPEPVEPTVTEVTMTIGNLDYYDGNIYTLTLKDANPTDTYEASLSFKLPASETLQLVSGDYPVSTGSGEMTLDAAKSSWTFIDKENFNDRIKNTIKEGSLTVTNNGNHNYTVTGTLRGASDTGQETAVLNELTLKDAKLKLCLADTTAQDTTQSAPTFWKFKLEKIDLANVDFQMDMPLDSMNLGLKVGNASLRDGLVDLHKAAYSAKEFKLLRSGLYYNSGNTPPIEKGLDPSHIAVTDINLQMDSLYYQGNNIRALLHQFELKERSGLEIKSTEGQLQADEKAIRVPSLQIKTANSFLALKATIDWSVTEQNQDGVLNGQFMAEIGKADLFKLIPDMPQEFIQSFPAAPLQVRIGVDGSLSDLKLTTCQVKIPDCFRMEMDGTVKNVLDSLSREGVINLNSDFYKMDFLSSLTDGVVIPSGMNIHGKAGMKGNDLFTETTLSQNEGKVQLNAEYNLLKEAYKADMQISELNLHDFLPADSLFYLSAGMQLEGAGTDIFSKRTTLTANAALNHLQWGTRVFSGVQLNAALKESKANLNLDVNDNLMNISSQLDASLHPSAIAADMLVQVKNLDLYGMGLLSSPLKTAENIDIHLKTDMKKSHGIRLSVKDINLITEKKTFKTKDNIGNIINLLMKELNARLEDKEITVKLSDSAKAGIIAGGYDPVYGARPLKRYLQKTVETLCAKLILANSVAPGDTILIDDTGNGLTAVRQTD